MKPALDHEEVRLNLAVIQSPAEFDSPAFDLHEGQTDWDRGQCLNLIHIGWPLTDRATAVWTTFLRLWTVKVPIAAAVDTIMLINIERLIGVTSGTGSVLRCGLKFGQTILQGARLGVYFETLGPTLHLHHIIIPVAINRAAKSVRISTRNVDKEDPEIQHSHRTQ